MSNFNKKQALDEIKKNINRLNYPKMKETEEISNIFYEEFSKISQIPEIIKNQEKKIELINFILDIYFKKHEEIERGVIENITSFLRGYDGEVIFNNFDTTELLIIYNKIFDNKILNQENELNLKWKDIDYLFSQNDEDTEKKNKVNTLILENVKNKISLINKDEDMVNQFVYGNKQIVNHFVRNFYAKINEQVKGTIMLLAIIKYCESNSEKEKKLFDLNFEYTKNIEIINKLFKKRNNNYTILMKEISKKNNLPALAAFMPKFINNLLAEGYSIPDLNEHKDFSKYASQILSGKDSYNLFVNAINSCSFFYHSQSKDINHLFSQMKIQKERDDLLNELKDYKKTMIVEKRVKEIIMLDLEMINTISKKETYRELDLREFKHNDVGIAYTKKDLVVMLYHENAHLVKPIDIEEIFIKTADYYFHNAKSNSDIYDYLSREINALFLNVKLENKENKNDIHRKAKI